MNSENPIAEVKPEVAFIFDLIRDVVAGRIRIPKFQRPFVWRREQMRDLLDSIRSQFPMGSLLLWETDQKLASSHWVGPIYIKDKKPGFASYVLDGQQRLSTFVGVLQKSQSLLHQEPPEQDIEQWHIWFNAKTKQFEHHKLSDKPEPFHCPLWSLMDTVQFLDECSRIMVSGDPDAKEYIFSMQELSRTFTSYKIPVIRLRNTNLSQAVEIFSRLNSKGQTISPDQMASALNYNESGGEPTFNLSEKIDLLTDRLDQYGFGSVDRTILLRTFMAAMEVDIYSKDWARLTDNKREGQIKLSEVIDRAGDALVSAVRFLHELGVKTTRLLPYAMQLIAIAAFYLKCSDPSPEQLAFLRKWFWVSSFTCHFASSNPSQDNHLVSEFRDQIATNTAPTMLRYMRLDTPAEPFPFSFDMRSARARCFLLVLLSLRPQDKNGKEIADPWRDIEENGPNSIGRILSGVMDKAYISSPANRILQIDPENRRQARQWLIALKGNVSDLEFAGILASHAIQTDAFTFLCSGDHVQFLESRQQFLIQLELQFMDEKGVTRPLDMEPKIAAMDTE